MFFRQHKMYENKLSEQISGDNPYKQKLIDMETPSQHHPIYSTLVLGLLIYCWGFFLCMFFKKACAYEASFIIIFFATCCLFFTYKKNYLNLSKSLHRGIFICVVILSILLEASDKTNISFLPMWQTFLFFVELNSKSYLVLAILAFFMLGVSLCYTDSVNETYKHFYEFQKKNKKKLTVEDIINANYDFACVLCLISPYIVYLALSKADDIYRLNLKLLSLITFLELPPYACRCFVAKRYLRLFNKAKKSITNN